MSRANLNSKHFVTVFCDNFMSSIRMRPSVPVSMPFLHLNYPKCLWWVRGRNIFVYRNRNHQLIHINLIRLFFFCEKISFAEEIGKWDILTHMKIMQIKVHKIRNDHTVRPYYSSLSLSCVWTKHIQFCRVHNVRLIGGARPGTHTYDCACYTLLACAMASLSTQHICPSRHHRTYNKRIALFVCCMC